jgi:MFS transporter, VNT family, synaptic vesicle glycoprotein 2
MCILRKVHKINCKKEPFTVQELIPGEEISSTASGKGLIRVMMNNTMNILKNYSRSFWLLSFLQFGVFYVAHGMLLFFPDILHKVSQSEGSGDESQNQICEVVRSAIVEKKSAFDEQQCVEHLDFSAFYYVIILESCYFLGFLVISLLVNYVGRMSIFLFVFITTGLCGILIVVINNLIISNYLYMWLLVIGVNSNLLNTVTFDAFPTELRSMAISTTLLFGRVGGLLGVNVSSFMVEDFCEMTFGISGGLLILCTVLTLFIPMIVKKSVN